MKKRHFLKLLLGLFPAFLISCLDNNEGNNREITSYEEFLAKDRKDSEGLPDNFIPDWYHEDSSK